MPAKKTCSSCKQAKAARDRAVADLKRYREVSKAVSKLKVSPQVAAILTEIECELRGAYVEHIKQQDKTLLHVRNALARVLTKLDAVLDK